MLIIAHGIAFRQSLLASSTEFLDASILRLFINVVSKDLSLLFNEFDILWWVPYHRRLLAWSSRALVFLLDLDLWIIWQHLVRILYLIEVVIRRDEFAIMQLPVLIIFKVHHAKIWVLIASSGSEDGAWLHRILGMSFGLSLLLIIGSAIGWSLSAVLIWLVFIDAQEGGLVRCTVID